LNAERAVQVHSIALKTSSRKEGPPPPLQQPPDMTFVIGAILVLFVVFTLT
jgi:hypothetical protein